MIRSRLALARSAADPVLGYTTNLSRRWRADDLNGTYAEDAEILSWPTGTGSTSDTATATTGFAGTLKKSIVSGRSVARFPGGTKYLSFTPVGYGDFTILVVCKTTAGTNSYILGASGNEQVAILNGNKQLMYAGGADVPEGTVTANRGSFHVLEFVRNASTASFYENGTSRGTAAMSNTETLTLGRIAITATETLFFAGDIAEILIYSADIGSTNRSTARSYLGSYYGITVI